MLFCATGCSGVDFGTQFSKNRWRSCTLVMPAWVILDSRLALAKSCTRVAKIIIAIAQRSSTSLSTTSIFARIDEIIMSARNVDNRSMVQW